jgi:hypothetical protein
MPVHLAHRFGHRHNRAEILAIRADLASTISPHANGTHMVIEEVLTTLYM